ncbi:MAG: hypothetical protein K2N95_15815 [Lachnospiraceae bacterium]|nr:hypothetical protein [Lachnospiraceae bacterium]
MWVYKLLEDAGIKLDAQGSNIKEIDDALKTASKAGTGNPGYPEYCGVVKDYVIVIEDKPVVANHVRYDENGVVRICRKISDTDCAGYFFECAVQKT